MTRLSEEELAAIREFLDAHPEPEWRGESFALNDEQWAVHFLRMALAHIDAITEAVEGLPTGMEYIDSDSPDVTVWWAPNYGCLLAETNPRTIIFDCSGNDPSWYWRSAPISYEAHKAETGHSDD